MRKRNWFIVGSGVLITGVIGSAIYFIPPDTVLGSFTQVDASGETVVLPAVGEGSPELTVSPPRQVIRPAAEVMKIEATGNITLQKQETVVSKVKALITAVYVKVGDNVAAGDVLVELDTQNLQREVEEARFNLSKAQTELKKLTQPAEPEKVTAAQQKLLIAQEELAKVKAGPEPVELQGAETEVFVAWAKYNDLVAGKSEDELASARTALKDAEIALKRAQEDYDSISWRSNFEIAEERAKTLQAATTAYENAKAAYNKAVQPAEEKDLRSNYNDALKAQQKLAELQQKPTKKELAEAELKALEAQQELAKLTGPPDPDKLAEAKMEAQKKELLLAEAETKLTSAKLIAPFAGTVVNVETQAGKTADVNDKLVTLANLQAFNLTVNVPEAKINRLRVGQTANITLDAVPDRVFPGQVSYISPINQNDTGLISYAVTVQLDIKDSAGILSGMTAVVNFEDATLQDAWLVPTTAIQPEDLTLTIYRANEPLTVTVKPGLKQGEWTLVHSSELQAGDEVEAELSSFLNEDPFSQSSTGESGAVGE